MPVLGVVVVAAAVVVVLVLLAVRQVDRHELEETRHLASAALRQITDDLRKGTLDYTWWDESVRNVVIRMDRGWAAHFWGYYQQYHRGNQVVVALAPDGEVLMSWHDSRPWFDGKPVAFEPGLDLLVEQALGMPTTMPEPAIAWMVLDGDVYAVAAAAITPSDPAWAASYGYDRGVGIFARKLQPQLDDWIGEDFLLDDLRIVPPGDATAEVGLMLPGPDGGPVAALLWTPRDDGREIVLAVLLPVAGAMAVTLPFLFVFVRRALRMLAEEDSLRAKLRREREVGAMKGRFVSMVSHEFRTPLTAILASSELLRHYGAKLSESEKDEELASIQREVDRLTGMVDDVITLGEADATGLEFRPEAGIELDVLLHEIAQRILMAADTSSEVTIDGAADLEPMAIDPRLVELAFGNVVGNAVKYSTAGEPIGVTVTREDGAIVVTVIDRGIGIPPGEIERIGQPFFRAANTGRVGGTGLGLAIARSATEAHGGSLAIESQLGRGTTVALSFRPADPGNGS